jgi:hypothetical protein
MRRAEPWLLALGLIGGLLAGAPRASAQPDVRDHHPPGPPPSADHDRRRPAPHGDPTEAPPSPREERQAARAGFTWIPGRWDWRGGKWEWIDGKWEKERAGKRWNPGHWDKQGDHWMYTEGAWIDLGDTGGPREAPPPPREERQGPRAGFTWVTGRWDWRNGKWEWQAGRWEKERPGKRWNTGRWDKQGDRYVWVEGDWVDAGPLPPGDRPRQPPPPPRDERPAPRAGYTYIHGRWDWRGGKWDWIEGRWEKERPGQQWREARWELRDGTYALVDGEWVNVGPPGSTPPPGDRPYERRVWRLERPTVSSYWPVKGKPGSRIVIRGRNFPASTAVMWGDQQLNGAKVTPTEIVVAVPANASNGTLLLRTDRSPRALIVGNFEVVDGYDAAAEAARVAEEARKRAEAQWIERQRQLAKDRAARQAAYDQRWRELAETRESRRLARLTELRAQWEAAFLADPSTQDELTLHAQRSAELDRAKEVAELSENGKLVVRIGVAQSREDDRHRDRMQALHDSFRRNP